MRPSHEASVEREASSDGAWARSLRRVPAPHRPRLAIDDFHGIIGPILESLTPLARCHASRFTAGSVFLVRLTRPTTPPGHCPSGRRSAPDGPGEPPAGYASGRPGWPGSGG